MWDVKMSEAKSEHGLELYGALQKEKKQMGRWLKGEEGSTEETKRRNSCSTGGGGSYSKLDY